MFLQCFDFFLEISDHSDELLLRPVLRLLAEDQIVAIARHVLPFTADRVVDVAVYGERRPNLNARLCHCGHTFGPIGVQRVADRVVAVVVSSLSDPHVLRAMAQSKHILVDELLFFGRLRDGQLCAHVLSHVEGQANGVGLGFGGRSVQQNERLLELVLNPTV